MLLRWARWMKIATILINTYYKRVVIFVRLLWSNAVFRVDILRPTIYSWFLIVRPSALLICVLPSSGWCKKVKKHALFYHNVYHNAMPRCVNSLKSYVLWVIFLICLIVNAGIFRQCHVWFCFPGKQFSSTGRDHNSIFWSCRVCPNTAQVWQIWSSGYLQSRSYF